MSVLLSSTKKPGQPLISSRTRRVSKSMVGQLVVAQTYAGPEKPDLQVVLDILLKHRTGHWSGWRLGRLSCSPVACWLRTVRCSVGWACRFAVGAVGDFVRLWATTSERDKAHEKPHIKVRVSAGKTRQATETGAAVSGRVTSLLAGAQPTWWTLSSEICLGADDLRMHCLDRCDSYQSRQLLLVIMKLYQHSLITKDWQ